MAALWPAGNQSSTPKHNNLAEIGVSQQYFTGTLLLGTQIKLHQASFLFLKPGQQNVFSQHTAWEEVTVLLIMGAYRQRLGHRQGSKLTFSIGRTGAHNFKKLGAQKCLGAPENRISKLIEIWPIYIFSYV